RRLRLRTLQSGFFHHLRHYLNRSLRMFLKELLGRLASLSDSLAAKRIPSAAFLYDSHLASEVDDFAIAGDAGSIENVELRFFERGCYFVLDDFHPRAAADDIVAFFQRSDAADIHAHGGVKLERVAASGGFGVAEHDTNFHANLVDEDDHGLGTGNSRRKFPQGLR